MSEAVNAHPRYRLCAAAFLQVFDRYRSRLMSLKLTNKRRASWMLACPPAGAAVSPQWPATWACDQALICPFCRFRQAVELLSDPWVALDTKVYAYWKTYEFEHISDWMDSKRGTVDLDRQAFCRQLTKPNIRFQRIGLEAENRTKFFYRMLQLIVTTEGVDNPRGFTVSEGPYYKAVILGMRYAAANLLAPPASLIQLMIIPRFRKVEYGRKKL